jgi:DNA-binding response OmpR family regulator
MTRRILIVDSNEAFATMLQESLEQDGEYRATVTAGEDEALQALATARFDLAIVDLGLADPDGATVARTLRQQQAGLRLMLIPFMGEELPSELADMDVQGILPKPFFFPELPGRIADALAQPVGRDPDIVEATDKATETDTALVQPVASIDGPLAVPREHIPEIVQEMTALSQEINAEGVILTREDTLAQAVAESWRTSTRVAQILGREQPRFEQSVEGGEHVFYSLAVADDIILSAAMYANVPLGIIRHRAKKTADALRALVRSG